MNADGTRPPQDGDDEALEARLFEVLGRLDEGALPDEAVEAVCADAPELVDDLRRRLALLADMGVLVGQQPQQMPERLGRFRLLSTLGGGGMGVVHLAHDEDLDRQVALKVIRPEHLYFEGARERFRREVGTVAKLAHPNVVPVHSVGEEGGVPYFAMEHVRGCSLAEALSDLAGRDPASLTGRDLARVVAQRATGQAADAEPAPADPPSGAPARAPRAGSLDDDGGVDDVGGWLYAGSWEQTCLRIVRQVAGALDHAHGRGVLHRDIKPSNVMLSADGASRALLLDFGLASSAGSASITASSARLGSLPYMSPEQSRGEVAGLDARCDVYGLGVTLFELLTLRQAFAGPSDPEVLLAIQRGDHPRPSDLNPGLSWEAETVCLTAMEADPARRYASAADLARDLDNVLSHRPVEARRAGAWLRLRRLVQRRPTASVATVLGALLLVGGPSLYAWQQHQANLLLKDSNERIEADALLIGQQRDTLADQAEVLRARGEELERRNAEIAAQAEQVRRQFARALDTVDTTLFHLSDSGLESVPGMTGLRQVVLDSAMAFYDELLAEGVDGPAVLLRMAKALQTQGNLHSILGDTAAAEASQRQALAVLEGLAEVAPGDLEVAADMGLALREVGAQLSAQGHMQEALAYTARSAQLQTAVLASLDDADGYRRSQLVFTLANQVAIGLMAGEVAASAAPAEQGVGVARELVADFPDDPRHRTALARALVGEGNAARYEERLADAAAAFEEAVETYDASLSNFPGHPDLRTQLADTLDQLADVLPDDPRRALELNARAYDILDGLTRDFPESPTPMIALSNTRQRRAVLHAGLGEDDAAERCWLEAHMRFSILTELFPDLDGARGGLALTALNFGAWLEEQGRHEEALAMAEEALQHYQTLVDQGSTTPDHHEGVGQASALVTRARQGLVGS